MNSIPGEYNAETKSSHFYMHQSETRWTSKGILWRKQRHGPYGKNGDGN